MATAIPSLAAGRPLSAAFRKDDVQRAFVIGAMAVVLCLQLALAANKGINWDEFFHLSKVGEFARGELTTPLQTIYARLFAWVIELPGTSVDHIVLIRHFMLATGWIAAVGIFATARRWVSPSAALLCALAYLTAGYVFTQAPAFRADPVAAALLAWAIWAVTARRLDWRKTVLAGVLIGLAGLYTIKSGLYAPVLAAILAARWLEAGTRERRATIVAMFAMGALALAVFAAGVWLHSIGLTDAPAAATGKSAGSAANTVFSEGLFPRGDMILRQVALGLPFAALTVLAIGAWREERKGLAQTVLLAGQLAPLLTLVFYRNAYPYFFVFLLPPVAIAMAPLMERLVRTGAAPLLAIILTINAAWLYQRDPAEVIGNQQAIQHGVREVFPDPVRTIDFSGHLGDYPRATTFMTSGWGLKDYREEGVPVISQMALREPLPLLLNNHEVLDAALRGVEAEEMLLPEDARFLRENYIPHWGPLFVAGKRIAARQRAMTIAVPGTYTVEQGDLTIAGTRYLDGDTVKLDRGTFAIAADGERRLRWGDHLPQPSVPAPTGMLMSDY